jgi:hypothetical protein
MKIAPGADHAGFPLKGTLLEFLKSEGHEVLDLGTHSTDPVDYPDFAQGRGRGGSQCEGRARADCMWQWYRCLCSGE